MNDVRALRRPTFLDRETGILTITFWPLHRPRRSEETPWGAVDLIKRGRPTGIKMWAPDEYLPSDLLDGLADVEERNIAGERLDAGPFSYYDRGKERNVVLRTEMAERERTRSEPTRWGQWIKATGLIALWGW